MALMLNSVNVAGNLTRDPQVRFFNDDKCVCDFGLAINRKYRGGDGEMKEEVTFVDVECWNKQAELVGQYLTKGRNCLVEGSLKLDQWEDKDGNKRSKIKISAQRVHFIGCAQQDKPVPQEHQDFATGDRPKADPAAAEDQKEIQSLNANAAAVDDDEPPF